MLAIITTEDAEIGEDSFKIGFLGCCGYCADSCLIPFSFSGGAWVWLLLWSCCRPFRRTRGSALAVQSQRECPTVPAIPTCIVPHRGRGDATLLAQLGKLLRAALETQALRHRSETHDGEDFPRHLKAQILAPLQVFSGLGERETILAKRIKIHKNGGIRRTVERIQF